MPDEPTSEPYDASDKSGDSAHGELLLLQHGSGAYYVGQFPSGRGDRYDLRAAVEAGAAGVKGRIIRQRPVTVLGQPGRDAQIVYTEDGEVITSFSRYVLTPGRVFFLQYITFGDQFTSPPGEFRLFAESFRLTEAVGAGT